MAPAAVRQLTKPAAPSREEVVSRAGGACVLHRGSNPTDLDRVFERVSHCDEGALTATRIEPPRAPGGMHAGSALVAGYGYGSGSGMSAVVVRERRVGERA